MVYASVVEHMEEKTPKQLEVESRWNMAEKTAPEQKKSDVMSILHTWGTNVQ